MLVRFRATEDQALWTLFKVEAHPKLLEVFYWVCMDVLFPKKMGLSVTITSFYREGPGVHGTKPCRGLDFIVANLPMRACYTLAKRINEVWDYGKEPYKVCMWHTIDPQKKRGWHFHMQVRDETKRRET